ncbi:MAG TPA: MBL fold metallo-hydrolase [Gammaproteobacteria bacterium]|nr:MBL fold metallo-hydrolase [Gammaproteobacteria bacterium]
MRLSPIFSTLFFSFVLLCYVSPIMAKPITIADVDIPMKLKKVSDHVYYVQGVAGIATDNKGFISNAGVIIGNDGIMIFDALGTPSLAKKLRSEIRKISNKPIKKIFISHYHADHFFGLQGLLSPGVEIYAPAGAQQYLARDGAEVRLNERRKSLKPWVNESTRLIPPDHFLDKDMNFTFGGLDISVLQFGSAHSDGDLVMFVKQDKVLLTGDLLFTGRIPFVGGDDVQHWIAKIDELEKLPARWIIPGHGAAFQDFKKGSRLTKNYLNLLYRVMTSGVDELMSFEEIYDATDWREFKDLPAFNSGNRVNAYRVFLNAEKAALDNQ